VRDLDASGMSLSWAGEWVRVPLGGEHNVRNILAACSLAVHIGVGDADIRTGLAGLPVLFGRGEVLRGKCTVVQDCYNANPEAVIAAIAWADSIPCEGRRIYVIADMLELGEHSDEAHRRTGLALAQSAADAVLLYGEASRMTAQALGEAGSASRVLCATGDFEELRRALVSFVRSGDLVLLKGSRGMALERLASDLVPNPVESRGEVS
jgi:UDP-N-acetylmuramoyl-tripeptide--D-alanyl-D-alanine ligase